MLSGPHGTESNEAHTKCLGTLPCQSMGLTLEQLLGRCFSQALLLHLQSCTERYWVAGKRTKSKASVKNGS